MPDQGDQFGVDIHELWELATDIEKAANQYSRAVVDVRNTTFANSYDFGAIVVAPWETLRGHLIDLLDTTVTNLNDSATALKKAANAYAATDQRAADHFHELLKEDEARQA
jgi:hypothetical protein